MNNTEVDNTVLTFRRHVMTIFYPGGHVLREWNILECVYDLCTRARTMTMNAPVSLTSRDLLLSVYFVQCSVRRLALTAASVPGVWIRRPRLRENKWRWSPEAGLRIVSICVWWPDPVLSAPGPCCHVTPLMRSPQGKQSHLILSGVGWKLYLTKT